MSTPSDLVAAATRGHTVTQSQTNSSPVHEPPTLETMPDELLLQILKSAGTSDDVRKASYNFSLVNKRMWGVGTDNLYGAGQIHLHVGNAVQFLNTVVQNSNLARRVRRVSMRHGEMNFMTSSSWITNFRQISTLTLDGVENRLKSTSISEQAQRSILKGVNGRGGLSIYFTTLFFTPNLIELSIASTSENDLLYHGVRQEAWIHALTEMQSLDFLKCPANKLCIEAVGRLTSLRNLVVDLSCTDQCQRLSIWPNSYAVDARYSLTRFDLLSTHTESRISDRISTFLSLCHNLRHFALLTKTMETWHWVEARYEHLMLLELDWQIIVQSLLPSAATLESLIILDMDSHHGDLCALLERFPHLTELVLPVGAISSNQHFEECFLDVLPPKLQILEICGLGYDLKEALLANGGLLDKIVSLRNRKATYLHHLQQMSVYYSGRESDWYHSPTIDDLGYIKIVKVDVGLSSPL